MVNRKISSLLFLVLTSVSTLSFAQSFGNMKHGLVVNLGIPNVQTNRAFKDFVQGVVFANLNYQYRILGNETYSPTAGIGFSSSYLDVENFKIVGLNEGGLFSYGAYAKLGFESILSENMIMEFDTQFGYFFMQSSNLQTPQNIQFRSSHQHLFIQPGINYTLMVDERQGFSFNISWTLRDMRFNAYHLMVDELPGFSNISLNGLSSHINFGFGYKVFLQKPKAELE